MKGVMVGSRIVIESTRRINLIHKPINDEFKKEYSVGRLIFSRKENTPDVIMCHPPPSVMG